MLFFSATVGEKSRDSLIKSLQGQLTGMACSKHGSRSLDALWSRASPRGKELLAQELSTNESLLMANQFGKYVAQNLALSTFKRSKEDWRVVLDKKGKTNAIAKDFLADILGGGGEQKAKKRASVRQEKEEPSEENSGFVIDKTGEFGLGNEAATDLPPKKKKKTKSYLDDL